MTQATVIQTFDHLKRVVAESFRRLSTSRLYYVDIDRDEIWEKYLSGFADADERQEHNCNSCRSFLRQYAGIVAIEENKTVSIWDNLEVGDNFKQAVQNLSDYIHSRPITDVFFPQEKKCGTDQNFDSKRELIWKHFFIEVPKELVKPNNAPALATARDDKAVLKRSLTELTLDATETVLELINQTPVSLYRGKEFEPLLEKFVLLQRRYARLPEDERDNFCWVASADGGSVVSRIRNTAIGTLLIDLSEGVELDVAVTKFEKVVAPHNYKRPTSLVTPRMIEDAKAKLSELGLLDSLDRRYANEADIQVCYMLFKDKPQVGADVFDRMSKDALVNPRTLSKVEELSIEKFLADVVPKASKIELLLENGHLPNFVSLLAPQSLTSEPLFKWSNGFSWNYTGNIADSIKERVKAAGGNVVGELRCSLSWSNFDDLDIHVIEPNGNHIYYANRASMTSGVLDIDMNAGGGRTRTPVENIIWTNKNTMKEGVYQVVVHNYCYREDEDAGFAVQIECAGEVFDFEFNRSPRHAERQVIATFAYSKTSGIKFESEVKSNVMSRDKWGLKTNRWHKVTQLFLSPNHWERAVGNKHYMFMLEGCISDETPRPFFNEFLKPELDAHRKVLEILGGKVKIEHTDNQLSGLGFSETQRNSLIARVTSKFQRTLKIIF